MEKRAAAYRDVNHFEPVGVADQVVSEDYGALHTRVCPFGAVRVGDVEPSDSHCLDLVGLLGDESLDSVLVVIVKYGRHGDVATRGRWLSSNADGADAGAWSIVAVGSQNGAGRQSRRCTE